MIRSLLVIGGATATGKTDLAARWAEEFNGELISADSRQVYKGMNIGTGKDRPRGVKIWGYDLVNPNEDFSVADWVNFAWPVIKRLWAKSKLPIVVGGTGLYLKSLVELPNSLGVPPNKKLRRELGNLGIRQLQEKLNRVAPERFRQMNWSDRNNPRRLIRAIEVANYHLRGVHTATSEVKNPRGACDLNTVWIGLTAERRVLEDRIKQRVEKRAKGGITTEVKRLMREYADWSKQAFSATGYREWRDYIEGKISREQAIEKWQRAEIQYMRRQLTWFKKMRQLTWFDIGEKNWENQVKQWICRKLKFPTER